MANNGVYGTKIPANISPNDAEIYYMYRRDRSVSSDSYNNGFVRLSSPDVLEKCRTTEGTEIEGMYSLRLPLSDFSRKGIYTVYIKPVEHKLTIHSVGTLNLYPNVRGVVLDTNYITAISDNGSLVGYRIEYLDEEGNKTGNFKIITSNNKATNADPSSNVWMFNYSSNYTFCTVTPSANMSFNSMSLPDIGEAGTRISLVNTKFNPMMLEIEIVDNDIDTIATLINGDQLRNLDKALITTFDEDGGILSQSSYGNVVNANNGVNHDYRVHNENAIDFDEIDKLREIKERL